jgi:hypothetical protein
MAGEQPRAGRAAVGWTRLLRRHGATMALVVAAAVLAALVLWDRGNVSTGESELRKRNLFEAWRRDEIEELRISGHGRTGTLRRRAGDGGDDTWEIEIEEPAATGPAGGARYPADAQTVADYLGRLEFATVERRVTPSSVDRAAFALDAPRLTVTVRMGKLRYQLVVGGPAADGGVYAEVEGRGVAAISRDLATALDVAPDIFRSKTLLPFFSTDFSTFSLSGAGGTRRFERAPWSGGRGAGFRWAAGTARAGQRAEARAMDKVLVALGQMQASRFLSAAPPGEPAVTLELRTKDGAAAVLAIGGECPGDADEVVVVRREPAPLVACAPASVLAALSTPADDFADRRAVGAEVDEVTEVRLEGEGKVLELARAGADWHMRAPADHQVPAESGRAFVEALRSVEARSFGQPSDWPGAVVATARVTSPTGYGADAKDREERIELAAAGAELTPVRRVEDGAVLMVPNALARALLPRDLMLRPNRIWTHKGSEVRSLRIESAGSVQLVERSNDGWSLLEPRGAGLRADAGLCNDLAEVLAGLTAERWISDRDDGTSGVARPRAVVEMVLEPRSDAAPDAGKTERRRRLEIGAPAPAGGAFARTAEDPAVFVLPRGVEAAALRLLVDRDSLGAPPAKLRKVTLSRPDGARLVMVREGEAWRLAEPANDPAAAVKVAALVATLDDLSAEMAVAVGAPAKEYGLDTPAHKLLLEGQDMPPVTLVFGAADSLRGLSVRYARRQGVDATFAVARSKLRALDDVW